MHLRRNQRLRREFLYRKSLEGSNAEVEEKKKRVRLMMQTGSHESVKGMKNSEVKAIKEQVAKDDQLRSVLGVPVASVDDEYSNAGVEDPKIFLTTSRDPSSRLTSFAKELKLLLPNTTRTNRGHLNVPSMMNMARASEFTDVIIVHETRGNPDSLIVSHLPYGPTVYFALYNVVLRHDIKPDSTMPLAFPHLVFHNFESKLGERVQNVLKYLFPVPKEGSERVVAFHNENDFISFRHYRHKMEGHRNVELEEMGPRFEMKPFRIRLGTIDQPEADDEWALRNFQNTSKKRKHL